MQGIQVSVEALNAVRELLESRPVTTRHMVLATDSGARAARASGRGIEYDHSRAYVAGDDMRTMDWRLLAKTGEPHTRQFVTERARHTILAVDLSASMFFGSRYSLKSWSACQIAAHLGWQIVLAGDQPGWIVGATSRCRFHGPGPGRAVLGELFRQLTEDGNQDPQVDGPSTLNTMLRELTVRLRSAANILLITDFIGLDDTAIESVQMLASRHRLTLLWLHDQTETETWAAGAYPIRVGEHVGTLDTREHKTASWLLQQQRDHRRHIETLARQQNLPLFPISCNRDPHQQLREYRL